jgi:hypothetical protein
MFAGNLPDLLATGEWVWTLGFMLFLNVLFGCAFTLLFLYFPLKPQHIEATTEELHIKHSGLWWIKTNKEQVIRWDDARLFAVCGGKARTTGTRYELAGADISLEWRDYRQGRWWMLHRADEQYKQQMEMLLAYISARTGLPLYDLR